MRIAQLTPTYWPEVMRGTERFVHDLSARLVARGHEVTVLTTHRGRRQIAVEDGIRVVRRRRPPDVAPLRHYEYHLASVPGAVLALRRGEFDLVHAHFPTDALAAAIARGLGGPPYVFTVHGIPTRRYLVSRRYRLELLEHAGAGAAVCTVGSEAAAEPFRRFLRREPEVIHPGTETDRFVVDTPRSERPTLICAASLGDPRKRAPLMFDAFERLRADRPELRLLLFEGRDPVMSAAAGGSLPKGAELLAVEPDPARLAARYAESWASVLPAVEEAFGLVLTESLAAGTPIVADRSGAGPEILAGDESIGRLFEPDDPSDLARAIAEALDLGADPATAARCRARAAAYGWGPVVDRFEQVYAEAAAAGWRN